MKKKLLIIFISLLLLVGCNKEKEGKININLGEEEKPSVTEKDIELYSDNTKLVYVSEKAKLVYYYSGETITGYYIYIDYGDGETAQLALTAFNTNKSTDVKRAYTRGKYLVIEYNESEYKDLSVSKVKKDNSYLEEAKK